MQLDETDWQILNILSEENQTNSAIARQLGLSEGAIRQRIKKLTGEGILKIKALRDPNALDNQQLAVIAISVEETKQLDIKAREIAKLKNVLAVSAVSGQYDLLAEVLVDSNKGLVKFLIDELASVEGVAKTESFVVLKSYNKFI